MKFVFDNIIFSLQKAGGISVVWYELLSRMLNSGIKNYLFIEDLNCKNNIERRKLTDVGKNLINVKFNRFNRYLDVSLKMDTKFIFHSSYYRICKNPNAINITTVHDFTYEYYSRGLKKILHSWQKRRAIEKSDFIICISENTKRDLLKFVPSVNPEKIKVIYNGVSNDYYVKTNISLLNIPFKSLEYVLFVGARDNYKNFRLAIEAISKSTKKIVIVGAPLNENEISFIERTLKDTSKYYYAGRISNEELNNLYNHAFALLYPSIYEGFGIPVIEAQKAGCPVIAYNGSSIPEIVGDKSLLINELKSSEICKRLDLLEDKEFRGEIIRKGLENSKRFSWDNMYEEIMEVYKRLWKGV